MLKRVFASLTENTIDAYNPKEFLQNFKMHGDLSLNAIGQQDAMQRLVEERKSCQYLLKKTGHCIVLICGRFPMLLKDGLKLLYILCVKSNQKSITEAVEISELFTNMTTT
ncbi:hypothetical protein GJ496_006104 [Pomphorhynchus laevis]|nr:hypothetical protein GJ496_006104 [Pomphorhynchus laevis]